MRFRVLSEAICSGVSHEFFADLKEIAAENRKPDMSTANN